jgi:O-antigen/teichoic acid export membrane protein
MRFLSINCAIFDQAIISGSNFLVAVFLAKYLATAEYGLYVFAFTTIVLASGLASSSIYVPLNLVGIKAQGSRWANILGTFFYLMVGLAVLVATLMFLLFFMLQGGGYDANAHVFLSLAFTAPLVICYEFIRSAQLTRLSFYQVLLVDIVTYAIRGASVCSVVLLGVRDCTTIVYIFGCASIIGLLFGGYLLQRGVDSRCFQFHITIAREAWKCGKWTLADWFPFVIYGQAYIYIVAFVLGNHDNGVLGVGRNLVAPVMVILLSINSSLLPYLRGLCSDGQYQRMATQMVKIFASLGACIVLYLAVVCYFAQDILSLFSTEYASYTKMVYIYAAISLVSFIYKPAELLLLAELKTKHIFTSRLFTALPTLIICYPVVKYFRFDGALYVVLLAHILLLVSFYCHLFIDWKNSGAIKGFSEIAKLNCIKNFL